MLKNRLERANELDAKREVAAIVLSVLGLTKKKIDNVLVKEMVDKMLPNLEAQARDLTVDESTALRFLAEGIEGNDTLVPPPLIANVPVDRPSWYPPQISKHSLERFWIHKEGSSEEDLLWDITGGVELDHRIAIPLMGRVHDKSPGDIYVLGRMRLGIHVMTLLADGGYRHCTYLRMSKDRVDWVAEAYPVEE